MALNKTQARLLSDYIYLDSSLFPEEPLLDSAVDEAAKGTGATKKALTQATFYMFGTDENREAGITWDALAKDGLLYVVTQNVEMVRKNPEIFQPLQEIDLASLREQDGYKSEYEGIVIKKRLGDTLVVAKILPHEELQQKMKQLNHSRQLTDGDLAIDKAPIQRLLEKDTKAKQAGGRAA